MSSKLAQNRLRFGNGDGFVRRRAILTTFGRLLLCKNETKRDEKRRQHVLAHGQTQQSLVVVQALKLVRLQLSSRDVHLHQS